VKRKVIALLILLILPFLMAAPAAVPVSVDWGYAYARMGMSDLELATWSIGTGVLCALSFTGVAGIGCVVSSAL